MLCKKKIVLMMGVIAICIQSGIAQVLPRTAEGLRLKSTKIIPKVLSVNKGPLNMAYVGNLDFVVNEKKITFFVTNNNELVYFNEHDQAIFRKQYSDFAFTIVSDDSRYVFVGNTSDRKCWLENVINGEILWEHNLPIRLLEPRASSNNPRVTSSGEVILSLDAYVDNSIKYRHGQEERLEFYDKHGNVSMFGSLSRADVALNQISNAISPEGNYYAINCNRIGGGSSVAFYDLKTLRELWRHDFKTGGMAGVAISPDGQHIVAVSGTNDITSNRDARSLHIFDKSGRTISEIRGGEQLADVIVLKALSPEGNYVVLLGQKTGVYYLFLVEVPTGELLWQYSYSGMVTKPKWSVFHLVSLSKDAERIAADYHTSEGDILLLLNRNGSIIWEEKLSHRAASAILSNDGRNLWHTDFSGNLYHYQFQQ